MQIACTQRLHAPMSQPVVRNQKWHCATGRPRARCAARMLVQLGRRRLHACLSNAMDERAHRTHA
jgi:hypothetical protein